MGRSLSTLKKPDADSSTATGDIKKIEDEIAEMLNLASVDPNEIVVFHDCQGKLKTSNISLDDILIKRRDATEGAIAVFSDQGKLKPDVHVSTIVKRISDLEPLKTLSDEYNDHIITFNKLQKSIVDNIDKPVVEFFGNPPVTIPKLTTIKDSMLEFATLQSKYEEHVNQFSTFRKNIVDKFLGTTFDKL